ncbi:MAG: hypothetical protein ACYSTS_10305 [Planctomycetota bacterium]|jgi:hypothetical protein
MSICITNLSDDPSAKKRLYTAFCKILTPYYKNPGIIVDKELNICDTCYINEDKHQILSFFMIANGEISIEGLRTPCIYLGLSGARNNVRGIRYVISLYSKCLSDMKSLANNLGKDIVLWGTTVNPMIFAMVSKYLPDLYPKKDGSYSDEAREICDIIKKEYRIGGEGSHNPFVIKRIMEGIEYSDIYLSITKKRDHGIFQLLNIEESSGDRLLFLSKILPSGDNS